MYYWISATVLYEIINPVLVGLQVANTYAELPSDLVFAARFRPHSSRQPGQNNQDISDLHIVQPQIFTSSHQGFTTLAGHMGLVWLMQKKLFSLPTLKLAKNNGSTSYTTR